MAVWNLGSINEDRFYRVPRLPGPGETLTATRFSVGLGGKGANQSVAVAKAGSTARHIGRIGPEGAWARDSLKALGVDVGFVIQGEVPTGHANVHVDNAGENMIVIYPGANRAFELPQIETALAKARPGDFLLLQNETNLTREAAQKAKEKGLFVVYSAAPFEAGPARAMLPFVDILALNEIEAGQLSADVGVAVDELPVARLLVTRGAAGAVLHDHAAGKVHTVAAFPVDPLDTTGAGDCFVGYVVAGLDQGLSPVDALRLGAAAAALQVTRPGTSEAIPDRAEVTAFLDGIDN
ncbi:ribokinase [Sinisalibacter lacisalsi]|uniref:Ribokinase n=1 Tax=Sinisalibacter lacisalsi TaxID=1526570 RepID=A0ABQ1QD07_9RHOB|nr:ribokinase [Sinisalibacter lacisalsi]GGD21403.1 ribokinase [Sinisalibacter lacisalsi]